MSSGRDAEYLRRIMEEEGAAVRQNTTSVNQLSNYTVNRFDRYEELRSRAREIKEDAIEHLPELVEAVKDSVEDNGGRVYVADDSGDANRYIKDVVVDAGADSVVKSKSMTSEEIDVNDALESAGVDVWETDLGEFVIQVADESPSHLTGPAIHRSTESITDLFNQHFELDEPLSPDPHELTDFARDFVGEKILEADIGMTGANFVVAETGSIALVTNEGNARKSAVTPPTHIAVAGVEKIVPSVGDLQPFIELIAKTGTGQNITSYVSLLTPPVETPAVDFEDDSYGDEREFHLVLLDNGRFEMREDEDLRETLYCIRCGACANSCANFQSVGGHAFGGETYTGGIGTGWEAGVHGQDSAAEFNDLCTGCTRCVPKCPVKIDIPWINTVVRSRVNQDTDFLFEGLVPDDDGGSLQKRFFAHAETLARFGEKTPRLSNAVLGSKGMKWLLKRWFGVDPRRPLPRFEGETLQEWFRNHDGNNGDHEVVLYPDIYTNYFDVERGKAAVRVLESLDCTVYLPDVGESGRAPLSQGLLDKARNSAGNIVDGLGNHIDRGRDVVVVEPSDYAMFVEDYGKLIPDRHEPLMKNTYEVMDYVGGLLETEESDLVEGDVFYHSHCQQRTLGLEEPTVSVLEELGYSVSTSDVECCGMAGSFGYKSEFYEVSVDVGRQLAESVSGDTVVASGTSCREQLEHLLDIDRVQHPVELVDGVRERL